MASDTKTLAEPGFTKAALPTPEGEPDRARALREEAFSLLEALPVPSQDTEEWRYTDLSGLDLASFTPFTPGRRAQNLDDVDESLLAALGDVGERAGLLLQHNSETATAHLDPEVGAHFESIDAALRDHPDLIEDRLHGLIPADRTKFTALHAAFRTGGTFIRVPKATRVEAPVQSLVYLDADGTAVFPHTVIVLEEGAELTYIDRYVSPDLDRALSVAAVEIYAGPGSRLSYVSLQDWGRGVTHLSVQKALVDRDAEVRALSVSFGGALSRTEVESVLDGPGGHSEMLGAYFTDEAQHFDHRSLQDHVAPHCTSDLLYKGALRDESRAVYSGLIRVHKGAQKTDAFQTNRNIVLSDRAKADSIPNLEIEANDVKCSHAASVGPVSEDELFYLQSRGISREDAERLIVFGFFREVLDRVTLDEVRESVEAAIEEEVGK